jgi:ribosomal protein S1
MKEETLNKFNNIEFRPGDEFSFYIGEITKDNRIILTEENPQEKRQKLIKFIEETKDKSIEAKVLSVLKFGSIISLGE